ncbi:MAG: NADH-quinone oxidoreductase subunit NuoN [Rhodobacteraceae bacterium]|nr:NADH-quinone oxidoreductase subunit NuoN [Paracoccaceae bacterium]
MTLDDLTVVLPELVLAVFGMSALIWAVFSTGGRRGAALIWLTSAVFVGMAAWIAFATTGEKMAFSNSFVDDSLSRFAKVMILLSASVVLFISRDFLSRERLAKFEFPVLVGFAVLGMMVMVSANDLIVLYLGLELQSLSLYVLAAFHRNSVRSTEAGLKYFVLGALSSGLLLYGASLVYGFAGTTSLPGIAAAMSPEGLAAQSPAGVNKSIGLLFGMAFMIVALAFKVAAAPFHMWTPDVYEGSPTPVTALFSTAPKVAALVLLARLLTTGFGNVVADWQNIIAAVSVLSMFVGAITAIGQTDIKRLMAYSSIAHMGFALMGAAAGTAQGLEAMLLYMAIYLVMNVGTFAFILSMRRRNQPVTDIYALGMFSKQSPVQALSLMLLLFSMAGIVPLLGFVAKLYVFLAAIDGGMVWLAISGGIASVIGAFYYLRIVYVMYFGEQRTPLDNTIPRSGLITLVASAIIVVVGVVNLFSITQWSTVAALALFQ